MLGRGSEGVVVGLNSTARSFSAHSPFFRFPTFEVPQCSHATPGLGLDGFPF